MGELREFCMEQHIKLFYEISAKNDSAQSLLSQHFSRLAGNIINEHFINEEKPTMFTIKNVLLVSGLVGLGFVGRYYLRRYHGNDHAKNKTLFIMFDDHKI